MDDRRSRERICPICDRAVEPPRGVYRIGDTDYHRECFEQQAEELYELACADDELEKPDDGR